ncbi:pentatricopeptide repeat-containing At5g42450, mitochondrial [Olea europaea subsp. europaea]|uniref:Pentatricopeptide repeat-containing At5g42450, mitochondrial n=1 Tax=Olea europaea subsp. europaea TaxID=158383 RepID=A0A8S0RXI7_OLEEU|nr:pentatricopeptide repeat-containing At5g42450, mitochondrial [Olea europaea subsp. europaea]
MAAHMKITTCRHCLIKDFYALLHNHSHVIQRIHIHVREPGPCKSAFESNAFSDAPQLLDEMSRRDVVSLTALIGNFARQNQHKEAITLFSTMLHLNIRPNEYTFGTVTRSSVLLKDLYLGQQVHSFAKKIGLNSNVFVGSAVLDLYVKFSKIRDAERAFEDMYEPNVVSYTTLVRGYIKEGRLDEAIRIFWSMPERNVVSWNNMISGCSQIGHNEAAVNFFIEMLREGVMPSDCTFPCAMIAAANIGALGMGMSFHACAVKFFGGLDLFLANSLISFYAKCGSMENSLLVFNKLLTRNVVSWNAIICGYAQNGKGNEALEMYKKMKLSGVQPNDVTLLGLLLACNHVGLIDEGYKYFNQARLEDPSQVKAEHYASVVDLLSRSGRFQEAEKFIDDLPFEPGIGFWKALLGGCQIHSNLELGEFAARKILELDPGDVSSYVMISNAHSAAGRWNSVLKVREEMRERGLRRIPGCSWIEIKSKVHVFVTGDKRHGERDEIYRVLRFFIERLMDSQDTLPAEIFEFSQPIAAH